MVPLRWMVAFSLLALSACERTDRPDVPTAPTPPITLTVTIAGDGRGSVITVPSGLECAAGTCSAPFPEDWHITIYAVSQPGSTFAGWSGACQGTATSCPLVMSTSRTVTATFAR